jgi:hypothetical protein
MVGVGRESGPPPQTQARRRRPADARTWRYLTVVDEPPELILLQIRWHMHARTHAYANSLPLSISSLPPLRCVCVRARDTQATLLLGKQPAAVPATAEDERRAARCIWRAAKLASLMGWCR